MSRSGDWLVEWAERPHRYDLLVLLPNLGRGGAQRVASLLVNAWAEQGYRVCVATFSDKTEDAHRLDGRVTRLKVREFLRIRTGKAPKKGGPAAEALPPPLAEPLADLDEQATIETRPALADRLEPEPAEVEAAAPEPPAMVGPQPPATGAPKLRPEPEALRLAPAGTAAASSPAVPAEPVGLRLAPAALAPVAVVEAPLSTPPAEAVPASTAGTSLIEVLRTIKRTVRRKVRAALFPVREAGRIVRRRARDTRRLAREARRMGREARRMSREARRSLRAAGRDARREARSAARSARDSLRMATRGAERNLSTAGRDLRNGLGYRFAALLGLLDWLSPATDRLHWRGAMQCLRALRGAARDAGLAQRVVLEHGDLLTDRAKCRQVLAARMLMEHVQAPVTLAFLGATNIVAALARHGLPTRLVISERNDPARQELQPVWQELRPLMYPAADVVTANSLGAVATMRGWMPASRLSHVPNPLRVPPDPGTRRSRSGPCFISVGRLVPQKRVDLVLEAFARLRALDAWSFQILGDGPERETLALLAEQRGVAGRVRFHGHVDPFAQLYAADIFVLASDFEGMPNALLEAMACGVVPIVNDATPGPLEFVEHDRTGLVVPAGDLDALTAAMRDLAGDELRRARLAHAARERMGELAFDRVLDIWAGVLRLPELPAEAVVPPPRLAQLAR